MCVPAFISACLSINSMPVCLPTCLADWRSACLPFCLPAGLRLCLTCFSVCLSSSHPFPVPPLTRCDSRFGPTSILSCRFGVQTDGFTFLFVINLQLPRSFTKTSCAASVVLYWGVPVDCLVGETPRLESPKQSNRKDVSVGGVGVCAQLVHGRSRMAIGYGTKRSNFRDLHLQWIGDSRVGDPPVPTWS